MIVRSLQLTDFRNYLSLQLELGAGVHALIGDNAQGKTNLVEALVVLSTMKSFRGVTNDAAVRKGATSAFIRADIVHDDDREFLVEIEFKSAGRSVAQVNRKRIVRTRDLLGVLRTTVFMPDDRNLVLGGAVRPPTTAQIGLLLVCYPGPTTHHQAPRLVGWTNAWSPPDAPPFAKRRPENVVRHENLGCAMQSRRVVQQHHRGAAPLLWCPDVGHFRAIPPEHSPDHQPANPRCM